jgi:excisionase family DNA binding protein
VGLNTCAKCRGGEGMTVQLLTAEQLAERWQVPTSHVYRLTRQGDIPAVKLGRYYRYRLDAIETFELDGRGPLDRAA